MLTLINCQWYLNFFVTLAQVSLVLKLIESHVAFMKNMESIEFKKLGLGSYLRKNIDSFGDAHSDTGFCNSIREVDIQGELINNKFLLTYFKLTK